MTTTRLYSVVVRNRESGDWVPLCLVNDARFAACTIHAYEYSGWEVVCLHLDVLHHSPALIPWWGCFPDPLTLQSDFINYTDVTPW